jgi:gluconolactonase
MRLLAVITGALISVSFAYPSYGQQVEPAATIANTEGPTADAEGNIYFTGNGRIYKLATDGKLSIFSETAAGGLIFDEQWRLLACEGRQAQVTRTDLKTGKTEVLAASYEGKKFSAPNDLTYDKKGRIYFTDRTDLRKPEEGKGIVTIPGVYRIDPDGKVTRILAGPDIEAPNGITISPDDKTLYLVESNSAKNGARMIRGYDLESDGSVRNMRVFHDFYPGRSADGLAVDVEGNIYAAAGLNFPRGTSETMDTKGGVYVFSPAGKQLKFIPVPEDLISNLTFGGADMKTLYVTAGKTLYRTRVDITGTRK